MIQGYVHPAFADIANEMARMLPNDGCSGAAVAVYHQGRCVVDLWGGCRDSAGNPWQRDTLAVSFSTTKGVASTLLHVLAQQGLIEYHKPVHHYWPEFRRGGKRDITVAHLLSHQSGLYDVRSLVDDASRMLDWEYMTRKLAETSPLHRPGAAHGYHAFTYGWLLGELIQRVTGKTFNDVLQSELLTPLKIDGLFIGLPDDQFQRRASLKQFAPSSQAASASSGGTVKKLMTLVESRPLHGATRLLGINMSNILRGLLPRGMERFSFNDDAVVRACLPAANGMFSAQALARMYAMMANGGELDGARLLSPQRIAQISQVQSRKIDKVVPLPMHWRLGYHRVFALGARTPHAFGHFGFLGSGGWCDPTRHLAFGFTVNSSFGGLPGDHRIAVLGAKAIHAAERVEGVKSRGLALAPLWR